MEAMEEPAPATGGESAAGGSVAGEAAAGEPGTAEPESELSSADASAPEWKAESEEPMGSGVRAGEAAKEEADAVFMTDESAPELSARAPRSGTGPAALPSTSGLKAGFADDNRQFNYFLSFLEEYRDVEHFPLNIQERIILRITDSAGKTIPNAQITVSADGQVAAAGRTFADGTFLFFPAETSSAASLFEVRITHDQISNDITVRRDGPRTLEVPFQQPRPAYDSVPLDLLFILDTTGSMGEEIERLKTTIDIINANLTALSSRPQVRFGMVLYKDLGDEYRTQVIPLTSDMDSFRSDLSRVDAAGGGDYPEDLQAALDDAIHKVDWNEKGVRLGFIITDATAHLTTYDQPYTYTEAARDAKAKAIKLFSVGTGGLDVAGEYVLRQISQFTSAKYIFLTYGEEGESEGGAPGSVSHHTGANYETDKLEAIIIRFAKEELSHLTDEPLEEGQDYYQAVKIAGETKEETLAKLFDEAIAQLVDYSAYRIETGSPAAVLPVESSTDALAANAEYFTDHLVGSLSRNGTFQSVERKDLQSVLEELELQLSDLVDAAPEIGKILEAKMLIAGKLYRKESSYELFLKLLRVETGEILSVSQARIDGKLGL